MIRKLRLKFMAVFLSVTALSLAILLVCINLLLAGNFRRGNQDFLQKALKDGTAPDGRPFAVLDAFPDGHYRFHPGSDTELTEEELDGIMQEAFSGNAPKKISEFGRFRFQAHPAPDGALRIAVMDASVEKAASRNLARNSMIFGLIAEAVLGIMGVFLSGWMVRPVEESIRSRQQFVADASHELRTPLTVALSNLSLMENAPDDETNFHRLRLAREELQQMKGLVDGLLTLARADAAEYTTAVPEFAEVDLSDLVQNLCLSFEGVLFEAGKELETDVAESCTVMGCASRLGEVVRILLDNAAKYADPGTTVQVSLTCENKEVRLRIASIGAPIAKENRERIFERFFREDASRETVRGYGLGLSIAKEITAAHGGSIGLSVQEQTNIFTVTLPAGT